MGDDGTTFIKPEVFPAHGNPEKSLILSILSVSVLSI